MSNRFDALLAVLAGIHEQLERIADANTSSAPNYQRRLEEFGTFDWSTIGALVLEHDGDGPAAVEWRGRRYTRRAPQNKFDPAIWFSRAAGKDEDGTVHYDRLITFKNQAEPEPLPAKAKQAVVSAAASGMNGYAAHPPAASSAPSVSPAIEAVRPAPVMEPVTRLVRFGPLAPDALKRYIEHEAQHTRAASATQTGAVHQALEKVLPDEGIRRAFQAWLIGHDSMADWTPQQVLAVHGWLKPSAGNGPTDKWCREEIALAIDALRPAEPAEHPVWEHSQDAIEWAFRQGVYADLDSAAAAFKAQHAAWGRPEKQEMFRRWEIYVSAAAAQVTV